MHNASNTSIHPQLAVHVDTVQGGPEHTLGILDHNKLLSF